MRGTVNLFDRLPASLPEEMTQTLFSRPNVRIERIVSLGHVSPPGFWYDQPDDEWVVLLSGAARLRIEGQAADLELKPGDCVHLPAHQRHRVEWTDAERHSVWLAVHFT